MPETVAEAGKPTVNTRTRISSTNRGNLPMRRPATLILIVPSPPSDLIERIGTRSSDLEAKRPMGRLGRAAAVAAQDCRPGR